MGWGGTGALPPTQPTRRAPQDKSTWILMHLSAPLLSSTTSLLLSLVLNRYLANQNLRTCPRRTDSQHANWFVNLLSGWFRVNQLLLFFCRQRGWLPTRGFLSMWRVPSAVCLILMLQRIQKKIIFSNSVSACLNSFHANSNKQNYSSRFHFSFRGLLRSAEGHCSLIWKRVGCLLAICNWN